MHSGERPIRTEHHVVLGLVIGAALRLPGWSAAVAWHGFGTVLVTAVLVVLVVVPLALAASAGRGYLAAVGVMFVMTFLAQIIAVLGYGQYFPWSVPALYAGVAGADQPPPGPVGYVLVVAVGVAGAVGTAAWWRGADHSR